MSETQTRPPVDPAAAFESLTLLAHRWTALVDALPVMANHALTVPAFVVLTAAAAESGSPIGKLARKRGMKTAQAASALRSLQAAGLVERTTNPDGKGARVAATAKGLETIAALRAGFASLAAEVPEANWRAVPRVAAIVRRSSRIQANQAKAPGEE